MNQFTSYYVVAHDERFEQEAEIIAMYRDYDLAIRNHPMDHVYPVTRQHRGE